MSETRELAYICVVDDVTPIENADRLELAHIRGWQCVVGKGEFHKGDLAVYFETDAQVPDVEPFSSMEFLAAKHFKIKIQKIRGVLSNGLLVPVSAFGWELDNSSVITKRDASGNVIERLRDRDGLTERLGVIYNEPEDNFRKAPSKDKYKKMAARFPKLFSKFPIKQLYKSKWGKKLLFIFFGRKSDKRNEFPNWVVKTDETRVENMPWILSNKTPWIASEKIDGSSSTYSVKKLKKNRYIYYVCSRNVVMQTQEYCWKKDHWVAVGKAEKKDPNEIYYKKDFYSEMSDFYNIAETLLDIAKKNNEEYVTFQGEVFGEGVQKRNYSMKIRDLRGFNLIFESKGRLGSIEGAAIMKEYKIPWVPIVDDNYILPDTIEELKKYVAGKSVIDGGMREGIVFRSPDGKRSFKCVDDAFVYQFHR